MPTEEPPKAPEKTPSPLTVHSKPFAILRRPRCDGRSKGRYTAVSVCLARMQSFKLALRTERYTLKQRLQGHDISACDRCSFKTRIEHLHIYYQSLI
jgi:hypothetical protein